VRRIAALLAMTLPGFGIAACGGTSGTDPGPRNSTSGSTRAAATRSAPTRTAPGPKTRGRPVGDVHDGDDAYEAKSVHEQNDDISIVRFGHEGSAQDKLAIAAALRSYYAAAARGDGAAACRSIVSGLAKAIPKEFLKGSSAPAASPRACAFGMSKFFARNAKQLKADAAGFGVVGVRINGDKAYALLKFKRNPEPRVFAVERERGIWKMEEFVDGEYP
jgi:hypothetical protein